MGQIIALPPSRGSARQTPAAGGAEILFFMGVRYHRMTDEEFAKATAKPRAKGRATGVRRSRHDA